jgi:hypothetical protein
VARCADCAWDVPTAAGAIRVQPILDTWHRVTECKALDAHRVAALRSAAALAAAHANPQLHAHAAAFAEVEAHRHTAAGRMFVFLATLGMTVPRMFSPMAGLPASWCACFIAPPPAGGAKQQQQTSVSAAVTLPAFAPFARSVASAIESAPPPLSVVAG